MRLGSAVPGPSTSSDGPSAVGHPRAGGSRSSWPAGQLTWAPTRRGFLGASVGLASTLALSACTGASTQPSPRTFTALYEGAGSSETLDPGTGTMFIDEARIKHLYDGLFEIDSTMAPVPRLATSAEPDAEGTTWRLQLREAEWHDGSPFTAEDVLYTLSRILGPQQGPKPFVAASTLSDIDLKSSRARGNTEVEIALSAPSFDFPTRLTAYGTRMIQKGQRDMSQPVGTGPFRFQSFSVGREFVATRNPAYWDGAPSIRELHVVSAAAEARTASLRSGQADFADNLEPLPARQLRDSSDLSVAETPNSGILYFAMKTDRAPFDDPDVRRAMMYAVDREELVRVALEGSGEVANDVFGRGYRYYADDLEQHEHDPERARSLLRRAGAEDLAFELFVAPVARGFVEAAQLFKRQAKDAGVTVEVRTGSEDTYYTQALRQGDMTMGQSGPLAIPYHFGSRLLSDAPQNFTHWADPDFDNLYARAQRTRSDDARARIYHRMHEMLHDRGGYIFWATTPWRTAYRSGWQDVPDGVPNAFDWARFDGVHT